METIALQKPSTTSPELVRSTVERLRTEYLELPGMRLTAPQVQRLAGVDQAVCRAALEVLVASQLIFEDGDGTYSRRLEVRVAGPMRARALGALRAAPCSCGGRVRHVASR